MPGTATHVDDVSRLHRREIVEQPPRRALERVGDDREPLAGELGIAERVLGRRRLAHTATRAPAAASSDRNKTTPSAEPSITSDARSGCGMSPTTLRPSLQMPAMSSRLPLGLSV